MPDTFNQTFKFNEQFSTPQQNFIQPTSSFLNDSTSFNKKPPTDEPVKIPQPWLTSESTLNKSESPKMELPTISSVDDSLFTPPDLLLECRKFLKNRENHQFNESSAEELTPMAQDYAPSYLTFQSSYPLESAKDKECIFSRSNHQ